MNSAGNAARRLALAAATLIVLTAAAERLFRLDQYSGSYPEGIRVSQLRLMAAGYLPFRDIFSDQGPWLLQALYPGFLLWGESLAGARITVVAASLVGMAAAAWLARQDCGRVAAVVTLALLAVSPLYLQYSRLAVAELLALAPATLALAFGLYSVRHAGAFWLVASATLYGVSLLLKPITLGAALPLLYCCLLEPAGRIRRLLLFGLVAAGVVVAGIALVGLPEVVRDIFVFRANSRAAEGWSFAGNFTRLRSELLDEGPALLVAAAIGLVLSVRRPAGRVVSLWLLATVITLLFHAPLHTKHFALLIAPLAVLAGIAVEGLTRLTPLQGRVARLRATVAVVVSFVMLIAVAVPSLSRQHRQILTSVDLFERDSAKLWYADAAETLRSLVGPGEFVVTDHAYLAFAADRLVPPSLVEASAVRVRARSLTDEIAIEETRRYGVRAVLLWADKLIELRQYRAWLTEHYQPVKVWAAEADTRPVLWLRKDDTLAQARETMRQGKEPLNVQLDAAGRYLHSAALRAYIPPAGELTSRSICSRAAISAEVEIGISPEAAGDSRVRLRLSEPSGKELDSEEEPLLGGLPRPLWIFWVGAVQTPLDRAGRESYTVSAGLVDARSRSLGPETAIGVLAPPCQRP